jgi:hypothetical protein
MKSSIVRNDISSDIVEFIVIGLFNIEEAIQIGKTQFPEIQGGVLWNFEQGELQGVDPEKMVKFSEIIATSARHKKTALYCPDELQLELTKMYTIYARIITDYPKRALFQDRQEAINWLMEE